MNRHCSRFIIDAIDKNWNLWRMSKGDSRLKGKALLSKGTDREREVEKLLAEKAMLQQQLKEVEKLIFANRAYIRELDIRSGIMPPDRRLSGAVSIKEMIMHILDGAATPLPASEIKAQIESRFARAIPRTSISPTLSKMAHAGTLRHEEEIGWTKVK